MNPVIHFEMPYEDGKRVARFYEQVFGWRIDQLGKEMNNYILATTAKAHDTRDAAMKDLARGAIDGGFFEKKPDWPAQYPSVVIGTQDIKATMDLITKNGGEVLGEPMDIPGTGMYVSFFDTEGNRVGILQPIEQT